MEFWRVDISYLTARSLLMAGKVEPDAPRRSPVADWGVEQFRDERRFNELEAVRNKRHKLSDSTETSKNITSALYILLMTSGSTSQNDSIAYSLRLPKT